MSVTERTLTPLETYRHSQIVTLSPEDNNGLINLCGRLNEHIHLIENRLQVNIKQRGYTFSVSGAADAVTLACISLTDLYQQAKKNKILAPHQVHLYLQTTAQAPFSLQEKKMEIKTRHSLITARGENQLSYLKNIKNNDINFGVGPAGTGKTYLAVACAVQALEAETVSRIILTRPIVEAGEKLGFLPGDLSQKVHPYLRPLYDALYEMMGFDLVQSLTERNIIELAPLAYMRGRSLNDSFIILDEGQNTTIEQMKMFLTRIGFNSKAVITGDITQIDLNNRLDSGLINTLDVLKSVEGISITSFLSTDVVRHPMVQRIVEAYERYQVKKSR